MNRIGVFVVLLLSLTITSVCNAQGGQVVDRYELEERLNVSKDLSIESEKENTEGDQSKKTRGIVRVHESADGGASNVGNPSVSLSAITFEFDSDVLTKLALVQLTELAAALSSKSLEQKSFELIGHTDAKGSDEYNLDLSNRRARSVVNFLMQEHGVDITRIKAYGMGEARLANPDEPYSSVNRRVEIIVQ